MRLLLFLSHRSGIYGHRAVCQKYIISARNSSTHWHKSHKSGWFGWLAGGAVLLFSQALQPLARNLFATVLNNELASPENNSCRQTPPELKRYPKCATH